MSGLMAVTLCVYVWWAKDFVYKVPTVNGIDGTASSTHTTPQHSFYHDSLDVQLE
jgi:hypothetical protein